MLRLHKHNKETYERLTQLFACNKRVAVVQPTGTGKSFIILKLISDNADKRFLILSPSVYIAKQIETHAADNKISLDNVEFLTYMKLAQYSKDEITALDCDYIILDEFHRCGAVEWGRGIDNLLNTKKNAKVLGTSATPIRYLDSSRNMAEELFNNVYAVNMSLGEAISCKILPLPIYITTVYSFSGDIEKLRIHAEKSRNPKLKKVLLGKIQKAKTMLTDLNCGVDEILAKHTPNRNGKYIVFCPNVEKLRSIMVECDDWFKNINPNIHKYSVYFENPKSQREFKNFSEDSAESAIKLLFCVDMLNEGIHIKDVEGVIMLRATQSANVFYQQLGRALVSGSNDIKHPIIFDIVNNYESGDTSETYAQIMEFSRENGKSIYSEIQFQLYDYVRDIRNILNELHDSFESAWEVVFESLCEFKEKYGIFPQYYDNYDGIRLGTWCSMQRGFYRKGKLLQERIDKLNSIGFDWGSNDETWQSAFEDIKVFKEKHNRFPKKSDVSEDDQYLFRWYVNQKSLYRKGTLSNEKAEKLLSIGMELEVKYRCNRADWYEMYERLKTFYEEHNRFPNANDKSVSKDIKDLFVWLCTQKANYKAGKIDDEKVALLNEINFVWDPRQALLDDTFELVRRYIEENGKAPSKKIKINGKAVGQWFIKQIGEYEQGKLSDVRAAKMESLNIPLLREKDAKPERFWQECYEEVKTFIDEHGHLPRATDKFEDANLYSWLMRQKLLYRDNELPPDKEEKIRQLGVDLDGKGSLNPSGKNIWFDNYAVYISFIDKNHRKPNSVDEDERKLYVWAASQKRRLKLGNLTEQQKIMLKKAGIQ
ncbi:MAG: Helicase associated domain protein [Firmicutes bacterium]|nr:Helicase associated domain protein [Bacillota bacterium]